MLHLRDMSTYITGLFESQQKGTFGQSNLHGDKSFKSKSDEQESFRGYIELFQEVQDHFHMTKIERVMIGAN